MASPKLLLGTPVSGPSARASARHGALEVQQEPLCSPPPASPNAADVERLRPRDHLGSTPSPSPPPSWAGR
eukprot:8766629-Pyramimonas_sp.AAC.1